MVKRVDYTIYPGKVPTVGMTFVPTPNLTYQELLALIRELQNIAREMQLR